jgi:8-oxo-dGTP diphosphatase
MTYNFPTIANVCYIINEKNEVLLQHKTRGLGKGKWIGPGGKIDGNESVEQSVKREVFEETNLILEDPELVAEIEFIFPGKEDWNLLCYAFLARKFHNKVVASDEGDLQWFKMSELPYAQMWEDDQFWLARTFVGEKMKMRFFYDKDTLRIKKWEYLGKL